MAPALSVGPSAYPRVAMTKVGVLETRASVEEETRRRDMLQSWTMVVMVGGKERGRKGPVLGSSELSEAGRAEHEMLSAQLKLAQMWSGACQPSAGLLHGSTSFGSSPSLARKDAIETGPGPEKGAAGLLGTVTAL